MKERKRQTDRAPSAFYVGQDRAGVGQGRAGGSGGGLRSRWRGPAGTGGDPPDRSGARDRPPVGLSKAAIIEVSLSLSPPYSDHLFQDRGVRRPHPAQAGVQIKGTLQAKAGRGGAWPGGVGRGVAGRGVAGRGGARFWSYGGAPPSRLKQQQQLEWKGRDRGMLGLEVEARGRN